MLLALEMGNNKGLGELASKGPLNETILDKCPTVELSTFTEVATILCDQEKWKN